MTQPVKQAVKVKKAPASSKRQQRDEVTKKILDFAKTLTKDNVLLRRSLARTYYLYSQELKKIK